MYFKVQLGRLFQWEASAATEWRRGYVSEGSKAWSGGEEEVSEAETMFDEKVWSPCSICKATVKMLYPGLSLLCNTIRVSPFGKRTLSLWRVLKVFLRFLLLQSPVSSAGKTKTNVPLGRVHEGLWSWLCPLAPQGLLEGKGCLASSTVLHQPPGSSAGRAAPTRSFLTPRHHQLLLSGGCTTGDRYNMATSLFLTDTKSPPWGIDIRGISWAQSRVGRGLQASQTRSLKQVYALKCTSLFKAGALCLWSVRANVLTFVCGFLLILQSRQVWNDIFTASPYRGVDAGVHTCTLLRLYEELAMRRDAFWSCKRTPAHTHKMASLPPHLLQFSLHHVYNLIKQAEQLVSGRLACQRYGYEYQQSTSHHISYWHKL